VPVVDDSEVGRGRVNEPPEPGIQAVGGGVGPGRGEPGECAQVPVLVRVEL
jgi:hypothetical protein